MKEQLVSFITAKLAKEKGFNIYCEEWFIETRKHSIEDYHTGDNIEFDYVSPRPLKQKYNSDHDISICSAPTQTLLQKWLREVHNIHIDLGWLPKGNCEIEPFAVYWWYLVGFIGRRSDINIKEDFGDYHTYEEALESALQGALKLI